MLTWVVAEFFARGGLVSSSLTPKLTAVSSVAKVALSLQAGWMTLMVQMAVIPCAVESMVVEEGFLAASVATGRLVSASDVSLELRARLTNVRMGSGGGGKRSRGGTRLQQALQSDVIIATGRTLELGVPSHKNRKCSLIIIIVVNFSSQNAQPYLTPLTKPLSNINGEQQTYLSEFEFENFEL